MLYTIVKCGNFTLAIHIDAYMYVITFQQKEATNMIADKLSSFQCFKTTTNSVDMMSKCISTSEVSPLTHTAASVPG